MSDQCQHCTLRGDITECLEEECFVRDNWFSQTCQSRITQLEQDKALLVEALENMVDADPMEKNCIGYEALSKVADSKED